MQLLQRLAAAQVMPSPTRLSTPPSGAVVRIKSERIRSLRRLPGAVTIRLTQIRFMGASAVVTTMLSGRTSTTQVSLAGKVILSKATTVLLGDNTPKLHTRVVSFGGMLRLQHTLHPAQRISS